MIICPIARSSENIRHVTGQLADTPSRGLVSSRTGQVADWTARRLRKSWSAQLAD